MLPKKILGGNTRCHLCDRKLSVLQRVYHRRFCSEEHHQEYLARQEQWAIEELAGKSLENMKVAVEETPPDLPPYVPPAPQIQKPEDQYRLQKHILEHLPGGVAVFGAPNWVIYFNETYRSIWHETGGQEPRKVRNAIAAAFKTGAEARELRIVLRPGKGGTVRLKLMRIPSLDGGADQLMAFATRVVPVAAKTKQLAKHAHAVA
jgi:hypothetical protein